MSWKVSGKFKFLSGKSQGILVCPDRGNPYTRVHFRSRDIRMEIVKKKKKEKFNEKANILKKKKNGLKVQWLQKYRYPHIQTHMKITY